MAGSAAAVMDKAQTAIGTNDEGAGKLHRVANGAFDCVAASERLHARKPVCRAHHLQRRAPAHAVCAVYGALRVGQAREGRPHARAQRLRLARVAHRHRYDVPAGRRDLGGAVTQRRQVFPAERSAKVAQKGDDQRLLPPQIGKAHIAIGPARHHIRSRIAH